MHKITLGHSKPNFLQYQTNKQKTEQTEQANNTKNRQTKRTNRHLLSSEPVMCKLEELLREKKEKLNFKMSEKKYWLTFWHMTKKLF